MQGKFSELSSRDIEGKTVDVKFVEKGEEIIANVATFLKNDRAVLFIVATEAAEFEEKKVDIEEIVYSLKMD